MNGRTISGNVTAATAALADGASVNAADVLQITPLHLAAGIGRTDLAQLLIENGADVNAKNARGHTPLDLAANNGHTDIVKLLEESAKSKAGHATRIEKRRGTGEQQVGS